MKHGRIAVDFAPISDAPSRGHDLKLVLETARFEEKGDAPSRGHDLKLIRAAAPAAACGCPLTGA